MVEWRGGVVNLFAQERNRSRDRVSANLGRVLGRVDTDVSFIMTRNERKKTGEVDRNLSRRERHEIPAIHDVSY